MILIHHGHLLVKEKRYRLISEDLKDQIVQWICKYDNVIHLPITYDTILVIDELTGKKPKRVGKLLLTCSIKELYNDLIIDVNDGGLKDVWNDNKLLVSETSLIFLLPDQLKKFTARYQKLYGCEYSIIIKQLQLTLNRWRKGQIIITCTRSSNEYFLFFFLIKSHYTACLIMR